MSNSKHMLCAICGARAVTVCMDCGRALCREHGYNHGSGRHGCCFACWAENHMRNAEWGAARNITNGAHYMHVTETIENAAFILRSAGLADKRRLFYEVVNLTARFMRHRKALNTRVAATAIVWHCAEHLDTAAKNLRVLRTLNRHRLTPKKQEQARNLKQIIDKWAAERYWRD